MSQANMELRFDMEDGKVQAGLKAAEQAERKLEVAVKAGNRTQKVRLGTENDLAKVLDVVAKGELRAASASQKRAQASLAAQKSAALLAKMQQDAAKQTRIASGWEATAARAQLDADKATQARVRRRLEETTKAQNTQIGLFRAGAGHAARFAGSLAGIGSAAVAAGASIRGLMAIQEHQQAIGDRQARAGLGLKEFVALQAPGAEGEAHVNKTLIAGASMGLTPEQTAAMAQPIQSVVDTDGDGRLDEKEKAKFDEDTTAAFRLAQLGVAPEDAGQVITGNRTKGIGGSMASNKLIAAADKSVGGPADFARAASAINQFEDSDTGLAVATALTAEGTPLEQLSTLTRGAALTLGSANDDSDFSKKFGLTGLSEAEKIAKLQEEGDRLGKGDTREARIADFSRSFKSKEGGGLDEEKARAMGLLVRQGDMFASTREALANVDPEMLSGKIAQLEKSPLTRGTLLAEEAKATAAVGTFFGPEAAGGERKRQARLERGAELQRGGLSIGTDPESGAATLSPGRLFAEIVGSMTGAGTFRGKESGGTEGVKEALQELRDAMLRNNELLEKNSAATAENTGASRGKTPVGGAASNAEEKY